MNAAEALARIAANWEGQRYMVAYAVGAIHDRRGPYSAEQAKAAIQAANAFSDGTASFSLQPTDEGIRA